MAEEVAGMGDANPGLKHHWLAKIPLWQGNVLFFLLLFFLAVSYFFFQINQAQKLFVADAVNHARLVAGVLRLQVKGTVISEDIINGVISRFLANSAEFVQYLDTVEPFTADELEAFAAESGLRGISLVRNDGHSVAAPEDWLSEPFPWDHIPINTLQYSAENHLLFFRVSGSGSVREMLLGIDAKGLEEFHQNVGLPIVLSAVEKLGGVLYIHPQKLSNLAAVGNHENDPAETPNTTKVIFKNTAQGMAAEVPMTFGRTRLVVGLDAEPLWLHKRQLWRDFFVFSSILAGLGGLLSYLLYRQQLFYVNERWEYDRRLALQREDAALGRSAAAIAHEIRNPLNAMAIALQRLSMEANELSADHRQLVDILLDSIKRTDLIIDGLLHYARLSQSISRIPVAFSSLVRDVASLYKSRFVKADIVLSSELEEEIMVPGDKNLLAQVLENVLRNASEAQPQGGCIVIRLKKAGTKALLVVTNPGKMPKAGEMDKIFAPYVTLKARGTGLGLAITKKIIKAHGGTVRAVVTADNLFELTIVLPLMEQ